jgi:four helix bundle protein
VKYSDLQVWQKAIDLVTEIYRLTADFPNDERFGLISQIRRAAVSIPANIAEGHGRKSTNAFINHLSIANGSLMELETHLQISLRLRLAPEQSITDILSRTDEIGKMISGLRSSLAYQVKETGTNPDFLNPQS